MGDLVFMLTIIVLGVLVYFLPSLVADKRYHRQRKSICVLNLLLGWTVLGWVVSMVWAVSANTEKEGGK